MYLCFSGLKEEVLIYVREYDPLKILFEVDQSSFKLYFLKTRAKISLHYNHVTRRLIHDVENPFR